VAGDKNKRGANEPEPRPIIVKKIIAEGHGGHHGGAWKVAYADFVTAMMAFFLLMWLLGATTEKQRKGLADYFTPTLVTMKEGSAGATGLLGGDSFTGKDNYPTTGGQGNLAITIPRDATGTADRGGRDMKNKDRAQFEQMKKQLEQRMNASAELKKMMKNVRFTETREGLRIDLIDQADFSMFAGGSDHLLPQAQKLLNEVSKVIRAMPNDIVVRGHTDGLPYASGRSMNNWLLSSTRAEATRKALATDGIPADRFAKIEGVADRQPYVPSDIYDPRNRRISIVMAWSRDPGVTIGDAQRDQAEAAEPVNPAAEMADMGRSALPAGAVLYDPGGKNAAAAKQKGPGKVH